MISAVVSTPPAGRDRQRVHVGHGAAVIFAGGVLVDRLDVVVDLHDLDVDAVFVGPFLHDAGFLDVAPGHPADIDRPADLEIGLLLRPGRSMARGMRRSPARSAPTCENVFSDHVSAPSCSCGRLSRLVSRRFAEHAGGGLRSANPCSDLPGFCPAVSRSRASSRPGCVSRTRHRRCGDRNPRRAARLRCVARRVPSAPPTAAACGISPDARPRAVDRRWSLPGRGGLFLGQPPRRRRLMGEGAVCKGEPHDP